MESDEKSTASAASTASASATRKTAWTIGPMAAGPRSQMPMTSRIAPIAPTAAPMVAARPTHLPTR